MRYSYAEILKKINRYFSGGLVEVKWRFSGGLKLNYHVIYQNVN